MTHKVRAALLAGVSAVTLTLAPQRANAIGADIVFDPTQYATQIEQYAEQINQTATQIRQLEQQVTMYEQMVQNAERLGNLPQLLSQLNLSPGAISAETQAFQSLNNLYQSVSSGQQLLANGKNILSGQGFSMPQFNASQFQQLAGQLYGQSGATNAVNNYNRLLYNTNDYMHSASNLVDLNNSRQSLITALNNQINEAASLGDNSEGATLQAMLAAQQLAGRQNDVAQQTLQVIADATLQEKLDRMNAEISAAENDLADTQARMTRARAAMGDFQHLGWTPN